MIAVIVQPTVGSISRLHDLALGPPQAVHLHRLDARPRVPHRDRLQQLSVAIAAFIALLQFSSNFAQGPFQGYVPDLVPAPQVGTASALVGLMQVLGVVSGYAIGALAAGGAPTRSGSSRSASSRSRRCCRVVFRVREGRRPKSREGRPWRSIAAEAWGTDILRERSFVWLVASRLAILRADRVLTSLAVFYLARTMGLNEQDRATCSSRSSRWSRSGPSSRSSPRRGSRTGSVASASSGRAARSVPSGSRSRAGAPSVPFAFLGALLSGSAGMFLAVDWALMTDIIPKASSGRYMGLSNVATASAGSWRSPSAGR